MWDLVQEARSRLLVPTCVAFGSLLALPHGHSLSLGTAGLPAFVLWLKSRTAKSQVLTGA